MSMTTIVPEERSDELAGHLGDGGSHLSVVRTGTDELISRLGELAAHIHAAQAELIDLLAQLDACQGWHGVGLRSIGHWASIELGIDARTATAQTHAGHLLASLPAIAAAARAGQLGWDKIKLLARVVEPASETRWLDLAREMSVGQLARVVAAYRRASDDHPDDHDRARRRRGIWLFDEPDGLVRVTALLEPDDAAILRAALAAHLELLWRNRPTTPNPAPEPNTTTGPNTTAADSTDAAGADRTATTTAPADPLAEPQAGTASQPRDNNGHHVEPATPSEVDPTLAAADPLATRRVDALVSLARTALAQPGLPDLADDTTQTILHIDHDLLTGHNDVGHSHYANGPSVPVPTARRLCCDTLLRPLIHTPNGQPLTLGRATRTPNRAQRRALRHRDRGCTFPGCQSRYWLDAHHITHWADGGSTDLDNLTLLCRHHHRLHHEGAYTITMVAGRPHFHRPDGTEIRPPTPSPPHPDRGAPALRKHHTSQHTAITPHTPRAHAGGTPHWSLPHTLDGLLN